MSDIQIWVFGILAFIVLITLASRVGRGAVPWWAQSGTSDTTKAVKALADNQAATTDHIAEVLQKTTSVEARLARIEQILKDVE